MRRSKIQLHRGGEVGQDIADGWRVVRELAEATHLAEHELERKTLLLCDILVLLDVWPSLLDCADDNSRE